MKNFSLVTDGFTESVIREMSRICMNACGINLAQGFPDFETTEEVKEVARQAITDGFNQYAISHGEPMLREAIAAYIKQRYDLRYDPLTEITVTCGATEAMMASLMAIINPGDEVVVFEPFYENYGPDAKLSGATPRYVTLRPPNWTYDSQELAAAFNERTKAVVINTPHNPTGKVFSYQELSEIAKLCQKYDCLAVTDEVYDHIVYYGHQHVPMAAVPGMAGRTLTINSASKTFSVTGWRVGWTIAAKDITARVRKVHDFLTVGAARPLQVAVAKAMGLPKGYYEDFIAFYAKQRDFLFNLLRDEGFHPYMPQGAYYILCQVNDLMDLTRTANDFDFCMKLIEMTGVAAVPGSSFYANKDQGSGQVRFCFCKKDETLAEVAKRLKGFRGRL